MLRQCTRASNADRLAKEGVRFRECHTGSGCQAVRASFLTGRLQHDVQSVAVTPYPQASYDPKVEGQTLMDAIAIATPL